MSTQSNSDLPRSKPVVALLVGALLVGGVAYWAGANTGSRRDPLTQGERGRAEPVTQPHPDLRPEEVVRNQLSALASETGDLAGVRQCFAYASPLNRQATGPIDRFAAMIAAPPYDVMLGPMQVLIGQPSVDGDRARVLVSLIDQNQQLLLFEFLLTRQTETPYERCWMTDAVFQIAAASNEPAVRPGGESDANRTI